MRRVKVLIAHKETLFRQALSKALGGFPELLITCQARFLEEAISLIHRNHIEVIVSDEFVFEPEKSLSQLKQFQWKPFLIILTQDPHKALEVKAEERLLYFYTQGYVVDLYRAIMAIFEGKEYAQPASIKNELSYLRSLEDQGVSTSEQLLLSLNKDDLRLMIDIIRGKSNEEILNEFKISPDDLDKRTKKLLKKIRSISS